MTTKEEIKQLLGDIKIQRKSLNQKIKDAKETITSARNLKKELKEQEQLAKQQFNEIKAFGKVQPVVSA